MRWCPSCNTFLHIQESPEKWEPGRGVKDVNYCTIMLYYATEAGGVCGSVHGELTFFPPYPDGLVAPTWGQKRPVGAPADEPAAGVRVCAQPLNQGQSLLHGRIGELLPSRCHWHLAEKRDRKWPETPKANREQQQQHYVNPKPQSTPRAQIQRIAVSAINTVCH